jgi:hypothetical protein
MLQALYNYYKGLSRNNRLPVSGFLLLLSEAGIVGLSNNELLVPVRDALYCFAKVRTCGSVVDRPALSFPDWSAGRISDSAGPEGEARENCSAGPIFWIFLGADVALKNAIFHKEGI